MSEIQEHVRTWESLRADARHHDSQVERVMSELEGIVQQSGVTSVATSSSPAAPTQISLQTVQRFNQTSEEVQQGIRKMQAIVSSMADVIRDLFAHPHGSSQVKDLPTMQKHTQRFEGLVSEKNQIVRHLTREFNKKREKGELLTKVHTTIEMHKETQEMEMLSKERESLAHTRRNVSNLLENASMNRMRLEQQRQRFLAITDNVVTILERVPFISNVLRKIDSKRRRDVIILGMVIAVCLFIIVLFF